MIRLIIPFLFLFVSAHSVAGSVQTATYTYILSKDENKILVINRLTDEERFIEVQGPLCLKIHNNLGYLECDGGRISLINLETNQIIGHSLRLINRGYINYLGSASSIIYVSDTFVCVVEQGEVSKDLTEKTSKIIFFNAHDLTLINELDFKSPYICPFIYQDNLFVGMPYFDGKTEETVIHKINLTTRTIVRKIPIGHFKSMSIENDLIRVSAKDSEWIMDPRNDQFSNCIYLAEKYDGSVEVFGDFVFSLDSKYGSTFLSVYNRTLERIADVNLTEFFGEKVHFPCINFYKNKVLIGYGLKIVAVDIDDFKVSSVVKLPHYANATRIMKDLCFFYHHSENTLSVLDLNTLKIVKTIKLDKDWAQLGKGTPHFEIVSGMGILSEFRVDGGKGEIHIFNLTTGVIEASYPGYIFYVNSSDTHLYHQTKKIYSLGPTLFVPPYDNLTQGTQRSNDSNNFETFKTCLRESRNSEARDALSRAISARDPNACAIAAYAFFSGRWGAVDRDLDWYLIFQHLADQRLLAYLLKKKPATTRQLCDFLNSPSS